MTFRHPTIEHTCKYNSYVFQETFGEDPYLIGAISVQVVKGLQGSHPRYTRVIAGCKVIAAYAGPDNYPVERHHFDAKVCMALQEVK